MRKNVSAALVGSLLLVLFTGCTHSSQIRQTAAPQEPATDPAIVAEAALSSPLVFVIYGDMRFTDPSEMVASEPAARHALVVKIAAERPDALFLTGDVPWHGGTTDDYRVYHDETAVWRERRLRVYPALGNHEFQGCEEPTCLENWWAAFPQSRRQRWYSVTLGTKVRVLALDSNASLLSASPQAVWLERQIDALPESVGFVIILLHHPPVTDSSSGVRANEQALAEYLRSRTPQSSARFLVCAAHVHNYERFERDGVVYLVSGGGGAKPSPVTRSDADLYKDNEFPNFHYLRFEMEGQRLRGEMVRLTDYDAPSPGMWTVKDRFELSRRSPVR
jgi:3',5'-cyclic AMP phosphodiesterase CpdA